ncbi:MAG: hypothetical protein D6720_01580 [Gammaproteobacteria bacterium]|nr:MAG: hypothetical protein D6720_01580 [Gammaproteobacteria bacterium]
MFGLRRSMLAVSDYLALEDRPRLEKWLRRFSERYRKIGEMVPEWREELDLEQLQRLEQAVAGGDLTSAADALHEVGRTCRSCHHENRALVAALMRGPDFSEIQVEDSETLEELPYKKVMQRLPVLVNRLKIADEDGRKTVAFESLEELRQRLADLGQSCESCHRDEVPRERILGGAMHASLDALEQALKAEDHRAVGRHLGELAVNTCARCHGVHRLLSDLRQELLAD